MLEHSVSILRRKDAAILWRDRAEGPKAAEALKILQRIVYDWVP